MSELVKSIDLFSLPFMFNVFKNDKKKKTFIGGLISLTVIVLSLSYFIYLCYLYFGNKINPSFAQTGQYLDQNFEMTLNNNILSFQLFLASGKTLTQLSNETGLIYLQVIPQYKYVDQTGATKVIFFNFIPCTDQADAGYYCLDFSLISNNQNQMQLPYNKDTIGSYKFEISFIICDPTLLNPGEVCAPYTEIRKQIIRFGTTAVMRMTTKQYSPVSHAFESKVKKESFTFTEGLAFITTLKLQKTTTNILEGFLFQWQSDETFLSDYTRQDTSSTLLFMQQELNLSLIGVVEFYLGENGITQQVSYPQFTYLLAQFSSVFNTLLFLGIFGRLIAENEIIQDFVEIQIKSYYKQTAWIIISKLQRKKQKEDKDQNASSSSLLTSIHYQIQNMDYKYFINKSLNLGFLQRAKLFIFNGFTKDPKKEDPFEIKMYKQLIEKTQKQMSILELQKEIMQLKIMMRMFLTVEQYAAIQLCGYSVLKEDQQKEQSISLSDRKENREEKFKSQIFPLSEDNDKKSIQEAKIELMNTSQERFYSHLDKIEKTQQDIGYFEKCLDRFFDKQEPKSDLDQRILSCISQLEQLTVNSGEIA